MSISSFGGASSSSGGSSTGIGELVQALGGTNLLPADGRVIEKSEYPELYEILNTVMAAPTMAFNSPSKTMTSGAYKIAYNPSNDTWVALDMTAGTNRGAWSRDSGLTWVAFSIPVNTGVTITWFDIVCNGTMFCAVSTSTNFHSAYSTDGINWGSNSLTPTSFFPGNNVALIANGSEFRVGNGFVGQLRSTDGQNWTTDGIPVGNVKSVVKSSYGEIYFGGNNTALALLVAAVTTDGGVTWTQTLSTNYELVNGSCAYQNKVLMLTATRAFVSEDGGVTWTITPHDLGGVATFTTIMRTESGWLCTANTSATKNGTLFYSDNGITWTMFANAPAALSTSFTMVTNGVAKKGLNIVCPVRNSGCVIYSNDGGTTWNVATLPTTSGWSQCIWNGTHFVIFAPQSTVSYKSTDGVSWDVASASMPALVTASSNAYYSGWAYSSTLGMYAMIVSVASAVLITSPDAITWTTRAVAALTWTGIAAKGGTFSVLSTTTGCASSVDGITWTARTMSGAGNWDIAATDTTFVAITRGATGASIAYATSPDGITWTTRAYATPVTTTSLMLGVGSVGTGAVIIDRLGNAYVSASNGLTWTQFRNAFPVFKTAGNPGDSSQILTMDGSLVMLQAHPVSQKTSYVECSDLVTLVGATMKPTIMGGAIGSQKTSYANIPGSNTVIGLAGQIKVSYSTSNLVTYSKLPDNVDAVGMNYNDNAIWTGTEFIFGSFASVGAAFILRSSNGTAWTKNSTPAHHTYVSYTKGRYQSVAYSASGIYSSVDGNVWDFYAYPNVGTINGFSYSSFDDKLQIIPYTSNTTYWYSYVITTSVDGKIAVAKFIPNGSTGDPSYINNKNGTILFNYGGATYVSVDGGVTWSGLVTPVAFRSIVYSEFSGLFVACTFAASAFAYTSSDTKTWTARALPSSVSITNFAMSGRIIIAALSSSAFMMYSPNGGNTWYANADTSYAYRNLVSDNKGNFYGHSTSAQVSFRAYMLSFNEATQAVLPSISATPQWFVKAK